VDHEDPIHLLKLKDFLILQLLSLWKPNVRVPASGLFSSLRRQLNLKPILFGFFQPPVLY
jgi:hypothetical protein